MKVSDFNFNLPEELIAQRPIEKRDESRLMVLKKDGNILHEKFKNIIEYLNKGDTLVLNNTKVLPARLFGIKENSEVNVEILLLKRISIDTWETLVRPGKRVKLGTKIIFSKDELIGEIIDVKEDGNRIVKFYFHGVFEEILDKLGQMPLPPYIREKLQDKDRYQTVYASETGSSAAPTAGLHFTKELLNEINAKGINICYATLHVGLGTFRPVKVENINDHKMHSEYYSLSVESASIINNTKLNNKRIVAVGTTSIRTLESIYNKCGCIKEDSGWTDIFIYPGYKFKVVDSLITNFHLPESTLIMLVSALRNKEEIMHAYNEAINEKYKFFSFGDAMYLE